MKSINLEGKKVAVIGSRDFNDKDLLYSVLTKNKAKIKLIVSGGARGADTLATEWASDYGVPYLVFPAMWHDPETGEYDKGAGFRRNIFIIRTSEHVICFWDGQSRGSKHSIDLAKEMGKPVLIVPFTPKPKVLVESEPNPEPPLPSESPEGQKTEPAPPVDSPPTPEDVF